MTKRLEKSRIHINDDIKDSQIKDSSVNVKDTNCILPDIIENNPANSSMTTMQESTSNSFIKASVSMTSLPPNELHDGCDVIKTKIKLDRPYNSLKKKRTSDRTESWRNSWGSAYSHSSCSLHSNVGLGGSGKDEFWAALQSNYNYIMDTNLLDTCKEARGEIEESTNTEKVVPERSLTEFKTPEEECHEENPRALRKWLRKMENKLSSVPTLCEATKLSYVELQGRLAQHSVLYYEIVSHARVVGACIKSHEKEFCCSNENSLNSLSSEEKSPIKLTTAAKTYSNGINVHHKQQQIQQQQQQQQQQHQQQQPQQQDSSIKGLERRYHLLYLKAIEIQCLFEILIKRKSSNSCLSDNSTSNEEFESSDNEPVSKLARIENFVGDETLTNSDNQNEDNLNGDKIRNIEISQDTIDGGIDEIKENFLRLSLCQDNNHIIGTNCNFDADSEGSDCEKSIVKNSKTTSALNKSNLEKNVVEKIMDLSNDDLPLLIEKNSSFNSLQDTNISINKAISKTDIVADIGTLSPIKILDNNLNLIPNIGKKRQRNSSDVSKFNRSNRKSKNCATFYFKHLDTDNEANNIGLSSQESGDYHSIDEQTTGDDYDHDHEDDDDGWQYTSDRLMDNNENQSMIIRCSDNSSMDATCTPNDDSDKENKNSYIEQKNSIIIPIKSVMNSLNLSQNSNMEQDLQNEKTEQEQENNSTTINCSLTNVGVQDQQPVSNNNDVPTKNETFNTSTDSKEISHISLTTNHVLTNGENTNVVISKKEETIQDSIKQLVLGAESLVRNEILKTPAKLQITEKSLCIKKPVIMIPLPNVQKRVHEWLEHQPMSPKKKFEDSIPTTDCEASGEYTESDSCAPAESDSSDDFTDSVATCMKTCESRSHFASNEIIGGSAEPMPYVGSNQSLNSKVIRRTSNRRNSDRPWSVSCLSQLTETNGVRNNDIKDSPVKNGLASHSISESALNILSSPARNKSKHLPQATSKSCENNRSTLKRRLTRKKKLSERKTDSGSEKLYTTLSQSLKSDSNSSVKISVLEDLTKALSILSMPQNGNENEVESGDDQKLMKPNFKVGSYTTMLHKMNNGKLGSLAALTTYMNDNPDCINGTDDQNNSFPEQAWDNYQEKYNSENYSEGFDSDAARRLLEFGDDYRNFLDSQSDCCSSLSAANNLESFSPPRMESLQNCDKKLTQETVQSIVSTVDHARRRRALELEYERRRKTLETKRKPSNGNLKLSTPNFNSTLVSTTSVTKSTENRSLNRTFNDAVNRKLDFNGSSNLVQNSRRLPDSEITIRRRKDSQDHQSTTTVRRRISRNLDQPYKVLPSTSSSSNNESEDEKEINNFIVQSRNRLENTNALKIRSHLLRPEDYSEIINTCRENIRCLDSVLRGPSGNALSTNQVTEIRDLLVSWDNLLQWSENTSVARKMQEEMAILMHTINGLGSKLTSEVDSVQSITMLIDELKKEKTELQACRTNMLRLNASVHSWLTRQELKLQKDIQIVDGKKSNKFNMEAIDAQIQINDVLQPDHEFHQQLKNDVSEMYSSWEEANLRIKNKLDALTASLTAWKLLDCGLSEFYEVLGKDRGTLEGIEGALERGRPTTIELAHVKLVAKLLSEKVENTQVQLCQTSEQPQLDARRFIDITRFAASNGSLSDSGISDGGATSDGGLSERERRLSVLRRLAKQLETALAPGSEALKSITARMEAAEAELKTLQNTCRDLIIRTAVSQRAKSQTSKLSNNNTNLSDKSPPRSKKSPHSKRKSRKQIAGILVENNLLSETLDTISNTEHSTIDSDILAKGTTNKRYDTWEEDDDNTPIRSWSWRVTRIAVPMQLALFTVLCAACFMQPHCCDSINNLAMSFTPQLRYIRGPPPI